jgi:hypothetical protein
MKPVMYSFLGQQRKQLKKLIVDAFVSRWAGAYNKIASP